VIEEILPPYVAAADTFEDPPEARLFTEELAALGKVGVARRLEFTTVRHCARRALGELGIPPVPLLRGVRGAPQWPEGVAGSMTHCPGYRAAAVGLRPGVRALGIDAEPHAPLPDGVLGRISLPDERGHLAALARARADVCWDRLLFCVKEAVYKAWFPLALTWLGFHEAAVTFDPGAGTFHARVLATPPDGLHFTSASGRWLVRDGFVVATLVVQQGS
jgi:4'-phosphopantetheinyl transferase EntD